MKKWIFLFLIAVLMLTTILPVGAENDIQLNIFGELVTSDQPPVIVNDRTLVPVRVISEHLGYQVDWEPNAKLVQILSGNRMIILQIGKYESYIFKVNPSTNSFEVDEVKKMDVAPQIMNGRTMVPIRFVSEAFDLAVEWVGSERTVVVRNKETVNESTGQQTEDGSVIKVLTNRTDLVSTAYLEYANAFNRKYPDIQVVFEAMTDYEMESKIRMSGNDYGDVLLIPYGLKNEMLANYFEPLGEEAELTTRYRIPNNHMVNGKVYGIPTYFVTTGFVYNKDVFKQAGISTLQKTPQEFLSSMEVVKQQTNAIPLYTNYAAKWPFNQWEECVTSVSGDPAFRQKMLTDAMPFSKGKPHYETYKLMFDLTEKGLVEKDPSTTNWDDSKGMLAKGDIATMCLGSWVVAQMKDTADKLGKDPDVIGFMPFPFTKPDGKMYTRIIPDYSLGINKYSKNKDAAKKWINFFLNESGFYQDVDGISSVIGDPLPLAYQDFQTLNVVMFEEAVTEEQQESLDTVDQFGEIGIYNEAYKQRMIESALDGKESFDDIMNDLNKRWAKGIKELNKQNALR
jgi:raffinose/stachyose/melibiose transport system substrate-binding protein